MQLFISKIKYRIVMCLVVALVFSSMPYEAVASNAASKPALSTKKGSVKVGKTKSITIKGVGKKKIKTVKVKSSDTDIAGASAKSKTEIAVTGKKVGISVITVTVTLKKAIAKKTVYKLDYILRVKKAKETSDASETEKPSSSSAPTKSSSPTSTPDDDDWDIFGSATPSSSPKASSSTSASPTPSSSASSTSAPSSTSSAARYRISTRKYVGNSLNNAGGDIITNMVTGIEAGTTIKVYTTVNSGYTLVSVKASYKEKNTSESIDLDLSAFQKSTSNGVMYDFIMPASDVIFYAYFQAYGTISVEENQYGIILPNATSALPGAEVILTAIPKTGYSVKSVSYTYSGKSYNIDAVSEYKGRYSFKMPAGNVSISATFISDTDAEKNSVEEKIAAANTAYSTLSSTAGKTKANWDAWVSARDAANTAITKYSGEKTKLQGKSTFDTNSTNATSIGNTYVYQIRSSLDKEIILKTNDENLGDKILKGNLAVGSECDKNLTVSADILTFDETPVDSVKLTWAFDPTTTYKTGVSSGYVFKVYVTSPLKDSQSVSYPLAYGMSISGTVTYNPN